MSYSLSLSLLCTSCIATEVSDGRRQLFLITRQIYDQSMSTRVISEKGVRARSTRKLRGLVQGSSRTVSTEERERRRVWSVCDAVVSRRSQRIIFRKESIKYNGCRNERTYTVCSSVRLKETVKRKRNSRVL